MNKMKPNILFSLLIAGWIPAAGLSAQTYDFTFAPNKADKGSTTIYITPDSLYPGEGHFGYDLIPAPDGKSDQPFFFSVDVPDGNYRITVTLGSKKKQDSPP